MNHRYLAAAFLFCSMSAPAFCAGPSALSSLPGEAPEPPSAAVPRQKDWTVLYFINGKNDLESSALMDFNQLELVGSTPRLNIVVEMGRMNGQSEGDDHAEGDWTGVRRYLVIKDTDTSRMASPVLEDRGRADMGSWRELADFMKWAKLRYPARRYALVLWDHGNGWKPVDPANAPDFYSRGFSYDEETGKEFSTPQIARALAAGGGVNFLMLDGCNMAMASVAYELKDQAEALTASEESEPGVTVRYAQFLDMLDARPSMTAAEFAANTVYTYRDYFLSGGDTEGMQVTQSALRTGRMGAFRALADAWAGEALKVRPETLRGAAAAARMYGEDPDYRDMYDFTLKAEAAAGSPGLASRGAALRRFLTSELLITNWAQDAASRGLSVYVPAAAYDKLYDGLAWSRDGLWDELARHIAVNTAK